MTPRPIDLLSALLAMVPVSSASAQSVPALTPVKPWVLNYGSTECVAERAYGNAASPITLGIKAVANGELYELLIARQGSVSRYAEQRRGSIDFGQGAQKIWLLRYGVPKHNVSIQRFSISAADMGRARSAKTITFQVDDGPDARFAVRAMPELLKGLEQCVTLLRAHWNAGVTHTTSAELVGGYAAPLFRASDYPEMALARNQEGTTQFLLLIDEQGKIANCDVVVTSGVPALDVMGCMVMRERAKFKPALDGRGTPVRSTVVTPLVRWQIP